MALYKKIRNKIIAERNFYLFYLPASFILFVIAYLLLLYPTASFSGVKKGINLCIETVIPSLFPFVVLSGIIYDLGIFSVLFSKAEKLTRFLFDLPSVAFPLILMSLIGGFPVGATLIEKAYDSKLLNRTQAQRMLLFCVNPGPAFVVITVGYVIMGSIKTGWIMYTAITLSSVIVGILSRFVFDNEEDVPLASECKIIFNPSLISKSISTSAKNMMNICVWVIIFSCITELCDNLPLSNGVIISLKIISEVTGGAVTASEYFNVPVVAAVISFAGICVHFQVMHCLLKIRLRYKYFISIRILSAALSCVITYLMLELFPQDSSVISIINKPQNVDIKASPVACAFLMIMCGLFIIGDNYIFNKKALKENISSDNSK